MHHILQLLLYMLVCLLFGSIITTGCVYSTVITVAVPITVHWSLN